MRPVKLSLVLATALLAGCATTPKSAPHAGPTFIDDDYPAALAAAKAKSGLVFIDGWAPWCHSCLSMKETVLHDPKLQAFEDRFVFLAVNTDKVDSAGPFLEKFPMEGWPTLFIVDPVTEKPVLKWVGTATLPQLEALLEDSLATHRGGLDGAEALMARGDVAFGERKKAEAAQLFEQALQTAPADWPRRERATEAWLSALSGADQHEVCAQKALDSVSGPPATVSWATRALTGMYCALDLDPAGEPALRLGPALEQKVKLAVETETLKLPVDDRSGLYEVWVAAVEARGDEAAKRALAARWLAFLDAEANAAPTPAVRAIFDTHRFSAAMSLGAPERAIPALEQSERDFPRDYNPPARLQNLYRAAGRLDDAYAAGQRALKLVEGPRRARVLNDHAEVLLARNEPDKAKQQWESVLALGKTLPASQTPKREMAKAEKKLAAAVPAPKQ